MNPFEEQIRQPDEFRDPKPLTGFDKWWCANEKQYSADACHMSEYHMASCVWAAALRSETQQTLGESVGETLAAAMNTARRDALEEVMREIALLCNRYMNTVEDYYLHGLWRARDLVIGLVNATPQGRQFQKDGSKPAESASVPCVVEAIEILREIADSTTLYQHNIDLDAKVCNFLSKIDSTPNTTNPSPERSNRT